MRRSLVLITATGVLTVSAAMAQQGEAAASLDDFVKVCTASALTPAELPAALSEQGLAKVVETNLRATVELVVYAKEGTGRGVHVTRQRFADAVLTTCQVSGLFASSEEDVRSLRANLEKNPRLGKVEGEIIKVTPTTLVATLKRTGNDPLLTVQVTASPQSTVLSMTHWDLKPGQ